MSSIISAQTAKQLFLEESFDLVLASEKTVEAASQLFEEEGNYAAANDILSRWYDYKEEMDSMMSELVDLMVV